MHIDKKVIESRVSIEDACRVNGIEIRKRNLILCPAHLERMGKPNTNYGNCMIYKDTNCFKCHSCGAGGDIFSLTMAAQHMEFRDAMQFLAEELCPEAITDDDEQEEKKRKPTKCPLTKKELELIGLETSKSISYIGMTDSAYYAKHPEKDDPWYDKHFLCDTDENGDTFFYTCDTYSPETMFRDNPDGFLELIKGKAEDTLSFCKTMRKAKSVRKQYEEYGVPGASWREWLSMKEDAARHAKNLCRIYGLK